MTGSSTKYTLDIQSQAKDYIESAHAFTEGLRSLAYELWGDSGPAVDISRDLDRIEDTLHAAMVRRSIKRSEQ